MLASITKIDLPPCIGLFLPAFSIYALDVAGTHACQLLYHCDACAKYSKSKNVFIRNRNDGNGESFLKKRLSERLIFTRFCASGRRPASIGAGSELHSSRTCETWRAIPDSVNCHFSLWNRCASSRSVYLSPKDEIKLLRSEGSERLVFEERCSDFAFHTLSVVINTNKNFTATDCPRPVPDWSASHLRLPGLWFLRFHFPESPDILVFLPAYVLRSQNLPLQFVLFST